MSAPTSRGSATDPATDPDPTAEPTARSDARPGPSAWDAALRLLGVRARSRSEMRERLTRKGFETDVVDDVMARLDASALLDDDDFADEWVRSRRSGRGRLALRHELRAKGVAADVVETALGEIDADDERSTAAALVGRKLDGIAPDDLADAALRDKAFRRLAGMLMRRGFAQPVAVEVITTAIEQRRQDAADR